VALRSAKELSFQVAHDPASLATMPFDQASGSMKHVAANNLETQLLGLSTLVQLTKRARHAATAQELAFVMVNETHTLVAYRQAVLWRRDTGAGAGWSRSRAARWWNPTRRSRCGSTVRWPAGSGGFFSGRLYLAQSG
jgi:hypothetical protein